MFIPKKFKFKKQQKGKVYNKIKIFSLEFNQLRVGTIGLKALTASRFSSKQIFTFKQTINKYLKKTGKLVLNLFPNIPLTKKPLEVRMGKGKGAVATWIFKIQPGFILCEIITDNKIKAIETLHIVQKKLNFKTKIIFN
jgi:large subunit ribosomal protein L16